MFPPKGSICQLLFLLVALFFARTTVADSEQDISEVCSPRQKSVGGRIQGGVRGGGGGSKVVESRAVSRALSSVFPL